MEVVAIIITTAQATITIAIIMVWAVRTSEILTTIIIIIITGKADVLIPIKIKVEMQRPMIIKEEITITLEDNTHRK